MTNEILSPIGGIEEEQFQPLIEYFIHGDDMQALEIGLKPGEKVVAEAGSLLLKDPYIRMETTTNEEGGVLKKLWKGASRKIAGESFFVTTFENEGSEVSNVMFAAPYPGKVVPLDLTQFGGEFICQRNSFLCAENGTDVEPVFTRKVGAGLLGGEGIFLQRLSGEGVVFVHAGGNIVERDLKEGEVISMDTGCLVGMESSVDYDIEFQKGVKNILFSGEGLALAKLTGPGKVYIQTIPFSRFAKRVAQAVGGFRGSAEQVEGLGGLGGELVKGILSGRG